ELNMIFGSIINENFKNEIMITVIATGFEEKQTRKMSPSSPTKKEGQSRPQLQAQPRHEQVRHEEPQHDNGPYGQESEESLDIPTFLRNRNKRNR
ncbi:cell division protein FtsZ, partial [Neobacillus drentensis]